VVVALLTVTLAMLVLTGVALARAYRRLITLRQVQFTPQLCRPCRVTGGATGASPVLPEQRPIFIVGASLGCLIHVHRLVGGQSGDLSPSLTGDLWMYGLDHPEQPGTVRRRTLPYGVLGCPDDPM
jgi:hypothetical protein